MPTSAYQSLPRSVKVPLKKSPSKGVPFKTLTTASTRPDDSNSVKAMLMNWTNATCGGSIRKQLGEGDVKAVVMATDTDTGKQAQQTGSNTGTETANALDQFMTGLP